MTNTCPLCDSVLALSSKDDRTGHILSETLTCPRCQSYHYEYNGGEIKVSINIPKNTLWRTSSARHSKMEWIWNQFDSRDLVNSMEKEIEQNCKKFKSRLQVFFKTRIVSFFHASRQKTLIVCFVSARYLIIKIAGGIIQY